MSVVARQKLVRELDALGYFSYASPFRIQHAIDTAVNGDEESDHDGLFSRITNRVVPVDAEDLAEGFLLEELERFRPFLEERGVTAFALDQGEETADLSVTVNSRTFLIGTARELDWNDWHAPTQRAMAVLNLLLEEAGAAERLYLIYMGELSQSVFLTPEMFRLIDASRLIHPMQKPKPIERKAHVI